jgi:hypothetical protein
LMPITTEAEPEDIDDDAPSRVRISFPLQSYSNSPHSPLFA